MELLELENIWKECNQKIADNNRINREILRRMLLHKPEKTINWIKYPIYYSARFSRWLDMVSVAKSR